MKDPRPEPQEETLTAVLAAVGPAFSFKDVATWVIEAGGEGASSISDFVTSRGELEPLSTGGWEDTV